MSEIDRAVLDAVLAALAGARRVEADGTEYPLLDEYTALGLAYAVENRLRTAAVSGAAKK